MKLLPILFLLTSCALPKVQGYLPRIQKNFQEVTKCTQEMTVKRLNENISTLNQYNGGFYIFTCAQDKYACTVSSMTGSYFYDYKCNDRLE